MNFNICLLALGLMSLAFSACKGDEEALKQQILLAKDDIQYIELSNGNIELVEGLADDSDEIFVRYGSDEPITVKALQYDGTSFALPSSALTWELSHYDIGTVVDGVVSIAKEDLAKDMGNISVHYQGLSSSKKLNVFDEEISKIHAVHSHDSVALCRKTPLQAKAVYGQRFIDYVDETLLKTMSWSTEVALDDANAVAGFMPNSAHVLYSYRVGSVTVSAMLDGEPSTAKTEALQVSIDSLEEIKVCEYIADADQSQLSSCEQIDEDDLLAGESIELMAVGVYSGSEGNDDYENISSTVSWSLKGFAEGSAERSISDNNLSLYVSESIDAATLYAVCGEHNSYEQGKFEFYSAITCSDEEKCEKSETVSVSD